MSIILLKIMFICLFSSIGLAFFKDQIEAKHKSVVAQDTTHNKTISIKDSSK